MTQTTVEHEAAHSPIDSFVLRAEHVPTANEIIELTEQYIENPVERITGQLNELALLYDGRTDRTTDYDSMGRSQQFDMFATRDAAGYQLEEIYTIQSQYSATHGNVRTYSVSVLDEEGSESYRMTIKKDNSRRDVFSIQTSSGEVADPEEREQYITDFLYRSVIATVRSTDRTPQQRSDADLDALTKLERRLYRGPKVVTSLDL